jgi:hypothetical protein
MIIIDKFLQETLPEGRLEFSIREGESKISSSVKHIRITESPQRPLFEKGVDICILLNSLVSIGEDLCKMS